FERSAGWNRIDAEQWVSQHLGLHDLGRTVRLDNFHRLDSGLAAFLSGFFSAAHPAPPAETLPRPSNPTRASVEFVPVPSLGRGPDTVRSRETGRGGQGPALSIPQASRKGGAGLEIDLSDA